MANQLFRDYLDGNVRFRPVRRAPMLPVVGVDSIGVVPHSIPIAPSTGPPQSASWRGRGRITKYARG